MNANIYEEVGSETGPYEWDYREFDPSIEDCAGDWFPASDECPLGGELAYQLALKDWSRTKKFLSWFIVVGEDEHYSKPWLTDIDQLPDAYVETVTREAALADALNIAHKLLQ